MASHPAIHVKNLSVVGDNEKSLLSHISFSILPHSLVAVVGLSGCGKSTLIRSLAGIQPVDEGTISFAGHSINEIKEQFPLAVGYIPQFGTFHGELTVREILHYASALRLPPNVSEATKNAWIRKVVELSRIEPLLGQRFSTLSGGQVRRLALAEELIGDPSFLLLDELTTGLDVFSDGEIMQWLRSLAHDHGKTIVLVTHGTEHLALSDAVICLQAGQLVHFGDYPSLLAGQGVSSIEELFGKFSKAPEVSMPLQEEVETSIPVPEPLQTDRPPNGWHQFLALAGRQSLLFLRERGQLIIQILLIVTFPLLVAIFALDGLPQVRASTAETAANIVQSLEEKLHYLKNAAGSASLISGLVMFQVILLTLMGANNGAREIARERDILKKELYAGLSPPAYIASKFLQLAALSFIQAFWMAWFVKTACGFPGSFIEQFAVLFATVLAMSCTCLAISAAASSPERASLLSIYLVGFQLPLSGAALALPAWIAESCRPFIAAYWGWSGYLRTLESTRYFRLVGDSTKTQIAEYDFSLVVLGLHVGLCLALAALLVRRSRSQ